MVAQFPILLIELESRVLKTIIFRRKLKMKTILKMTAVMVLMAATFFAGLKTSQMVYEEREAQIKEVAIAEIATRQQEIEDEEAIIRNLDAIPAQLAITSFDGGAPVEYGLVHRTDHMIHRYSHITTYDRGYLVAAIKDANERTTSARDYWYVAIYDSHGNEV
jgi:hypothetical protein